MKFRYLAGFSVISVVLAGLVLVQPTKAETVVTDDLIDKIETNCVENLASLRRLHQTDAFLRNDRGELYQSISKKLMVPLNQRLAANELNGSELVETSADFNKEYTTFYNDYIKYDNAMSQLLDIDCLKEPVTFYTSLLDTRQKRAALNTSDQKLVTYIKQYKAQFDSFRAEFNNESSL